MLQTIIHFFSPAKHVAVTGDESTIKKQYKKFRYSVFLSATLGYALFYVCRLSISVAKKPLVDANIFSESELGKIGAALFFTYAVGKLINGFFSDRTNINRFIATGLILTALVNLAMGAFPLFIVFIILWGLNGWFQSLGAAPCVVALTRWFSPEERGTYYGIWSASHNIGKAITFTLLPFLIGIGGWQWGFWGAGVAGILGAIMVFFFLHDSPESKGLPSVDSKTADLNTSKHSEQSIAASQKSVLKNPYIWILALSSALMYISRYAIESWGIFYAQAEKGYTNIQAGEIIGLTAITGIIGTVISGIVSDKFFKGSRNIPALIAGILNIVSLSIFLFYPNGNVWMDSAAMLIHGFAIGILITFLGGLMAVDIAPKQATGATMGLIGIASYAGAGIQELISGFLISDKKMIVNNIVSYDFSIARFFWFGAALLSALVALLVWNAKMRK
jgi:OPA family sugar phosphate sensor protein UhpC-like MFS transporter